MTSIYSIDHGKLSISVSAIPTSGGALGRVKLSARETREDGKIQKHGPIELPADVFRGIMEFVMRQDR